MDTDFTYRGKVITKADIEFINKLISENPDASRRQLSYKVCQAWNWVQKKRVLPASMLNSSPLGGVS